ncbi:MAG: signal protein [Archangium gephyra]|uniref:Signal protein n=1 Tax=Archangium gephyra TaxID=48 RepID=A0A2W5TFV7_9BACT|nr:MAG: signal protein [Archangium gephyra]
MSETPAQNPGGAKDRKLRNFLLDARFQLKFAAYFVALSLVVAGLLGVFLVRTTSSLFSQISASVEARKKAADTSRELGNCTVNNELAANMDNPELVASLAEKSKAIDSAFEAEQRAVQEQSVEVQRHQQQTLYALLGILALFIFLVALMAIVITHRIVGPLFRIKRMAREVASGVVRPPTYGLRPDDELQDVFAVFSDMVTALRARAEADLEALKAGDPESLKKLQTTLEERLNK